MYSPTVGTIYIFNLIVGTGALTLPKAMSSAGWLLSLILLCVLGTMSYITTTFVVESLSIANACIRENKKDSIDEDTDAAEGIDSEYSDNDYSKNTNVRIRTKDHSEQTHLLVDTAPSSASQPVGRTPLMGHKAISATGYSRSRSLSQTDEFEITQAVEMGGMADMFFNKVGRTLFYLCIAIYLYGDLAIYAAAVPKSLRDIVCQNMSCAANSSDPPSDNDICWGKTVTRMDVYRIFVAIFAVVLGPFTYFSVQKTKYLQILTTLCRWIAFITMIALASAHMARQGATAKPPVANLAGVPNLFGVSVYSFMCQHSLPSLVTPIREKRNLYRILASDYLLILLFYALLGFTAVFCFSSDALMDVYTLNFQDSCYVTDVAFLRYFLGLFPVFTLSTNFPIIAVTLRNNLKALFKGCSSSFAADRLLFPTLAIIPPVAVAFATNDLTTLVGITGSYAGAGIQYVVPACLVLMARREASRVVCRSSATRNRLRSPFSRRLWVFMVLIWAAICLIFVTTNHILSLT